MQSFSLSIFFDFCRRRVARRQKSKKMQSFSLSIFFDFCWQRVARQQKSKKMQSFSLSIFFDFCWQRVARQQKSKKMQSFRSFVRSFVRSIVRSSWNFTSAKHLIRQLISHSHVSFNATRTMPSHWPNF